MPIPSFDELLSKANEVSQIRADNERPFTNELIAKGLSDFVSTLLSGRNPNQKQEQYSGYLDKSGGYQQFDKPQYSGMSNVQKLFGGQDITKAQLPEGSTPITRDESFKYRVEQGKEANSRQLMQMRVQAQASARGSAIRSSQQQLQKDVSDYIYWSIGVDPTGKKSLTYGDAGLMLRAKGLDDTNFFRDLGMDVKLDKDPLTGEISPEAKKKMDEKRKARKDKVFQPKPSSGLGDALPSGPIHVRNKQTGETGTLTDPSEFDSSVYERIP